MVAKLLVEDKQIVVPGQELAEGMEFLPGGNIIRESEKLVSIKLGLVSINNRLVKVIPLVGGYIPKKGDMIIGKVNTISPMGWRVNFGWVYDAGLSLRDCSDRFIERDEDLTKYYNYGDYIIALITNVMGNKLIDISMKGNGLRKLGPGRILKISSAKVPRVIGKQGSMIQMIKEYTGCRVLVGQNGFVWLSGENIESELLAIKVIKKIEDESHISGLTDRIKEYLESEVGSKNGVREEI